MLGIISLLSTWDTVMEIRTEGLSLGRLGSHRRLLDLGFDKIKRKGHNLRCAVGFGASP